MKIKNENDLLEFVCSKINTKSPNVFKSIGDDCAVIKISNGKFFVITTDTSLQGPHFSSKYRPDEIAYKALSTNLSDIAAMGCIPKYILMSLTLPRLSDAWIKSFYGGLNKLIKKYNIALIGGDTNKGNLSITIQVIGINKNKILYRHNAKLGDDIYITGNIGSARAALNLSKSKKFKKEEKLLRKYLLSPIPRIEIGLKISNIANSCIDISDGLMKDLGNILKSSNVGADIFLEKLPVHALVKKIFLGNKFYECILSGGEDYELCFTAPSKEKNNINKISKQTGIKITSIGKITSGKLNFFKENKICHFKFKGFDHFAHQ